VCVNKKAVSKSHLWSQNSGSRR